VSPRRDTIISGVMRGATCHTGSDGSAAFSVSWGCRFHLPLGLPVTPSGIGCASYAGITLRIFQTRERGTTVIQIVGHLVGDGVSELEGVCQTVRPPFVVDLKDLRRVDIKAIEVLNRLADAGATLAVSPRISLYSFASKLGGYFAIRDEISPVRD
jgi:hypothetical protein